MKPSGCTYSYTIKCAGGPLDQGACGEYCVFASPNKEISIYDQVLKKFLVDKGMHIHPNAGGEQFLCNCCYEKTLAKMRASDDIRVRLRTDFYKTNSALFREHAITAAGLDGNPKASKAYALAYEQGHSGGMAEVYEKLVELADVIKD